MAGEGWQARVPSGIAGRYRGPHGVRGAGQSQGLRSTVHFIFYEFSTATVNSVYYIISSLFAAASSETSLKTELS